VYSWPSKRSHTALLPTALTRLVEWAEAFAAAALSAGTRANYRSAVSAERNVKFVCGHPF
jgi:hypothetical protein